MAIALAVFLNLSGLLAIGQTLSFFNDIESSEGTFMAGNLDFALEPTTDFSSFCQSGESVTRDINLVNNGNMFKYIVEAKDLSGGLCQYLNLEANLNGESIEYNGELTEFKYGPVVFTNPENWSFKLTPVANTLKSIQGEICHFKFNFHGSQTKNDLSLGEGFYDIEEIENNITYCHCGETKTMGYWKTHSKIYIPYLPQNLGNEIVATRRQANQVFFDYNLSMRNKLKGQLLAMKFNIAYFRIGDYIDSRANGKTLNELAIQADEILLNPDTSNSDIEIMKDLLDGINNLHQLNFCLALPPIMEEIITEEQIVSEEKLLVPEDNQMPKDEEPLMPEETILNLEPAVIPEEKILDQIETVIIDPEPEPVPEPVIIPEQISETVI